MRRMLIMLLLCVGCSGEPDDEDRVIPLSEIPPAAMQSAQQKLPDIKFDTAYVMPDGTYEIRGKNAQGKIREVEVKADGEVVLVE